MPDFPELICPTCAREVTRKDRACPHCGTNLRGKRALVVAAEPGKPQPRRTPLLQQPLFVGIAAACFFAIMPFLVRADVAASRTLAVLLVLWCIAGLLVIARMKLAEGIGELLWYLGRPFAGWADDPTDAWLLAFLGPAIIGFTLVLLVVEPALPPGVRLWH